MISTNTQPKTWRKVQLEEVVEIIDGDRGENYPGNGELLTSGYSIFLNTKNVSGTKFDFSNVQFISKEKDVLLRKGKLERGDFVLTTRGTIGNIAYYGTDVQYEHIRINSGMVVLRPKQDIVDVKFLNLFLVGQKFKNQIASLQSGSAQPQLPIRDLQRCDIDLPPFNEQAKISDALWPLDDKIENNNKIIKNLEETAQAIFKEWFVKFKFAGHEKTRMIGSELGKIPEGWEIKNVLEIVERIPVGVKYEDKTALPKGKVPILDQGQSGFIGFHNDKPGVMASIDKPVVVFTNHTCNYRLVTYPFSAIQNVLPYIGANGYHTLFVYYLTREKIKMQEYKGHWPEFEQQEFVVPPQKLAEDYASLVKPMVQKVVGTENENQKLAALRDLLLPKLMSGEIRA